MPWPAKWTVLAHSFGKYILSTCFCASVRCTQCWAVVALWKGEDMTLSSEPGVMVELT